MTDATQAPDATATYADLDLASLRVNRGNLRLDVGELADLAESIRQNGVIEPIVVIPDDDGYRILAGHRRAMAATQAGLTAPRGGEGHPRAGAPRLRHLVRSSRAF